VVRVVVVQVVVVRVYISKKTFQKDISKRRKHCVNGKASVATVTNNY
jgi:hypothetical protein